MAYVDYLLRLSSHSEKTGKYRVEPRLKAAMECDMKVKVANMPSSLEECEQMISIQVLDFQMHSNIQIYRDQNTQKKLLKHIEPSTNFYVNSDDTQPAWGEQITNTLMYLLRLESAIKLVPEEAAGDASREVHFMQMECIAAQHQIDFKLYLQKVKRMLGFQPQLQKPLFRDWTITDFDRCLGGNPLVT